MTSTSAASIEPARFPDRHRLGHSFWRFFFVCLCFDLGFGLYFFLINLYLAEMHFGTRAIGLIAGALTIGNVVATIPTGLLARRIGLRPLLLFGFAAAPLLAAARGFADLLAIQIGLSFLQGAAMCSYTVCFPPALARLTTNDNRTAAFSITFAAGIGSGAIAGLAGGWLPGWIQQVAGAHGVASAMRTVLLLACFIAICGILPLLRLTFPTATEERFGQDSSLRLGKFLIPFLIAVAIWNFATGAFAPFANLYLSGVMHVPLTHIGLIFSSSQLLQVLGVSSAPFLYRVLGKIRGIALLQFAAAVSLLALGHTRQLPLAITVYLLLMCFQYTCSPGIYSLAMDRTDVHLQSSVSAWQNLISCIFLAAAAALAGAVIAHFGYATLLTSAAALALVAAMCFISIDSKWFTVRSRERLKPEALLEPVTPE